LLLLLLLHFLQSSAGRTAIRRSIQGMLEELEYNLWEAILSRLVDYGHTISPELEMAALRYMSYMCVISLLLQILS
jgi:3-dehydroquinate synthase